MLTKTKELPTVSETSANVSSCAEDELTILTNSKEMHVLDDFSNDELTPLNTIVPEISQHKQTSVLSKSKKVQTVKQKGCNKALQTHWDTSSTFCIKSSVPTQQDIEANGYDESLETATIHDDVSDHSVVGSSLNEAYASQYKSVDLLMVDEKANEENDSIGKESSDAIDADSCYEQAGDEYQPPMYDLGESEDSENNDEDQYNVQQPLTRGKSASKQTKIVVFEEALVDAFDLGFVVPDVW